MGNLFPSVSDQISKIRDGDAESWNFICRMFETGLVGKTRLLLRSSSLKKKIVPEDVVQETLLKAWKHRASFLELPVHNVETLLRYLHFVVSYGQ